MYMLKTIKLKDKRIPEIKYALTEKESINYKTLKKEKIIVFDFINYLDVVDFYLKNKKQISIRDRTFLKEIIKIGEYRLNNYCDYTRKKELLLLKTNYENFDIHEFVKHTKNSRSIFFKIFLTKKIYITVIDRILKLTKKGENY